MSLDRNSWKLSASTKSHAKLFHNFTILMKKECLNERTWRNERMNEWTMNRRIGLTCLHPCLSNPCRLHDRKTEHFKAITSSCHASTIADHVTSTGHNWDPVRGKFRQATWSWKGDMRAMNWRRTTDYSSEIEKETPMARKTDNEFRNWECIDCFKRLSRSEDAFPEFEMCFPLSRAMSTGRETQGFLYMLKRPRPINRVRHCWAFFLTLSWVSSPRKCLKTRLRKKERDLRKSAPYFY